MYKTANNRRRTTERTGKTYDLLLKLLLIGDSGVGKSALLLRYVDDSFTTSFIGTIGIDFKVTTIVVDGLKVRLQIWDTAGQERFRTITMAYYRGAMGIMLVYDVTDERSFSNMRNWIQQIEHHGNENVNKVLVGNKCDMKENRLVESTRGRTLADEFSMPFFETSAKTKTNVHECFNMLARDTSSRILDLMPAHDRPGYVPPINLVTKKNKPVKCCK